MLFNRWHPEVAVRYLPVVREIKSLGKPSVLEIGSGGLGIAPYLGSKVTGVDTNFSPPFHPLLEKVVGSALDLPFSDKSFDVVIAVDILEHVAPEKRKKVLEEMRRVARKEIIIAVPTGIQAEEQDKELAKEYQTSNQKEYQFFAEHEMYGLPQEKDLRLLIGNNARMEKNEPLRLKNFLMRGWMRPGLLHKVFYWKILLLIIPLFSLFNRPPYYRTIFFEKL